MTNKINGIDVSECAYYNKDNEPYCCEIWENECEAQNCYFKQLKRLQEENNILKQAIKNKNFVAIVEENERLKKKQITKNGFICDCEQNAKYRQALEKTLKILC